MNILAAPASALCGWNGVILSLLSDSAISQSLENGITPFQPDEIGAGVVRRMAPDRSQRAYQAGAAVSAY